MLTNYKLVVAFKGTSYSGFQFQHNTITIEGELRLALRSLYKKEIKLISCGRTDKGVHADMHVSNFFADKNYPLQTIISALNYYLPSDIRVLDVSSVDSSFNARYSAVSRTYIYSFSNDCIPFLFQDFISFFNYSFDFKNLNNLLSKCIGMHDFVNFRNIGSDEKSTVREIYNFSFLKKNIKLLDNSNFKFYQFEITANGFLYRMVRNLVGALVEVLRGVRSHDEFINMLNLASVYNYTTAPSNGLSLVKVKYWGVIWKEINLIMRMLIVKEIGF